MNDKLIAIIYAIEDDDKMENVFIKLRHTNMWVVEFCGHILSKSKLDFIYEPVSSAFSPDEDTRFSSPDQAYEYYLKYQKKFF